MCVNEQSAGWEFFGTERLVNEKQHIYNRGKEHIHLYGHRGLLSISGQPGGAAAPPY